ncbi:unnamed protein product [Rhizopus stolonifer]
MTLEQQTEEIEMELSQIKATPACLICNQIICDHKKQDKDRSSEWNLTITNSKRGIQVQTSVKTLSDLEKFLKEGFTFFCLPEKVKQWSEAGGARMLHVTYPVTKVEPFFKNTIQSMSKKQGRAGSLLLISSLNSSLLDQQCQLFKQIMLRNYFTCIGTLLPILPISIYYPKLYRNLDSLLTNAVVSLAAYTSCEHVDQTELSFTRTQLADHCRSIAIDAIEEVLFEQDPTPELCCALLFISTGCLLRLNGDEARAYSNLCWQMISQMKAHQDPVQEQVRIRVFYLSRYLEFNFLKSAESTRGFTSTSFHISTLPTHLECEIEDRTIYNSLCCFQFVIRLMSCSAYNPNESEETFFSYFSGAVNSIASSTIQGHERILLYVRKSLPAELQIGNGPFEYTKEVTCTTSFVLRVNAVYYIYWLIIHCKIMQSPSDMDSTDAHSFRIDGGRALMITSICIDVLSKIYTALTAVSPCSVDVYWLATCLDISHLLSTSKNIPIREKAKSNRAVLSKLLKKKIGVDNYWQEDRSSRYCNADCKVRSRCSSVTSDSSGTSSCCDSLYTEDTRDEASTPLLDNLKESLRKYMVDNKIS